MREQSMDRQERLKEALLRLSESSDSERPRLIDELQERDPDLALELRSYLPVLDSAEARLGGSTAIVPRQIGRYSVERRLARGGMGEVYLAREPAPLGRRVAIKVIRPGLVSASTVRRFEVERDTLKALDHPHIARITDSGSTDDALPFVVMEYVDGAPLDRFIERQSFDLGSRIQLLQQICAAVAAAHLRGIIHRDLKPGNVLVCERDGGAHAKVIDFGIAKMLDSVGTVARHETLPGLPLGTLEYMSPEQALGLSGRIDQRADIYALGALLYFLCTRRLPRQRSELLDAAGPNFLQALEDRPIPPPSQLMASLEWSGRGSRLAARWRLRELDWIVLRALEVDPDRRFRTASEFCEDLERWKAGAAIQSAPPSRLYAARKYVRRHPLLTGAAVLILAGSTAFSAALALSEGRVRVALAATEAALEEQQVAARDADAAARFLERMISAASPLGSPMDRTVGELIDSAAESVATGLSEAPVARWRVRNMLAEAYRLRGDLDRAIRLAGLASEDAREAWGDQSARYAESLRFQAQALTVAMRFEEARSRAAEAKRIYEADLDHYSEGWLRTRKVLATIERALQNTQEAIEQLESLVVDQARYMPHSVDQISSRLMLVELHGSVGAQADADRHLSEARASIERLDQVPQGCEQMLLMAEVARARHSGDLPLAIERIGELIDRSADWYGEFHPATLQLRLDRCTIQQRHEPDWRALEAEYRQLIDATADGSLPPATGLSAHSGLTLALLEQGRWTEAAAQAQLTAQLTESSVGTEHPELQLYRAQQALALIELGQLDEARRIVALCDAARPHGYETHVNSLRAEL